jgi:mannan endo-1,4-beta-mannosidase
MKRDLLYPLIVVVTLASCGVKETKPDFIRTDKTSFLRNGKPYTFMGTNFWYGINLGSKGPGGDRERLIRELDQLAAMGVKNLRVMGGSEGPDTEGYRMLPSLQPSPGKYNQDVLEGLDFLLAEMAKRDMVAVMCMNNFWNWSGGVGQYLVWAGAADSIPNPSAPGGNWDEYQRFAASFYSNEKAMNMFNDHLKVVINRKNSITGILYREDPVIMSWELANEPRAVDNQAAFYKWVENTSNLIREMDPNHLITTGSEGNTSGPFAATDVFKDHNFKNIDYATIHLWVQNWAFYDPYKADSTYGPSIDFARSYIKGQLEKAAPLGKPLVLEEYGISRDTNNHAAGTPVAVRDRFYTEVFEEVRKEIAKGNSAMAGVNFWAWGGEGRPAVPKGMWKLGDNFIGDPPHEPQGWYSIFDTDSSTIRIIREYAGKINK